MKLIELFLAAAFTAIIFGTSAVILFALIADAVGWYDSQGRYCGPFSKLK